MNFPAQSQNSFFKIIGRGLKCRCPNCGQGRMFKKFLKVKDTCDVCGEELHHHRADDMPAYLVIAIVGHIVVPLLCYVEVKYDPPYWLQMAIWLPITTILSIVLLQPVKGAVVAFQWRLGLHGFDESKQRREIKN